MSIIFGIAIHNYITVIVIIILKRWKFILKKGKGVTCPMFGN